MKVSSELIEKFNQGDPISDDELNALIIFYTDLEQKLSLFGKEYHLVWKDVYMDLIRLNGYKDARKRK